MSKGCRSAGRWVCSKHLGRFPIIAAPLSITSIRPLPHPTTWILVIYLLKCSFVFFPFRFSFSWTTFSNQLQFEFFFFLKKEIKGPDRVVPKLIAQTNFLTWIKLNNHTKWTHLGMSVAMVWDASGSKPFTKQVKFTHARGIHA